MQQKGNLQERNNVSVQEIPAVSFAQEPQRKARG